MNPHYQQDVYQQVTADGYYYPPPHADMVYYNQPVYYNQDAYYNHTEAYYQPQQASEQYYYTENDQYYPAENVASAQNQPNTSYARGAYHANTGRGGRGRGYQSRGRHRRYNDNQGSTNHQKSNSRASANGNFPEDDIPVEHFRQAHNYHLEEDDRDKTFSETVYPPHRNAGASRRGGPFAKREPNKQKNSYQNRSGQKSKQKSSEDLKSAEGASGDVTSEHMAGIDSRDAKHTLTSSNRNSEKNTRTHFKGKAEGARSDTQQKSNAKHDKPRRKKEALKFEGESIETQRGSLIEQLQSAEYECMVCVENIRCEAAVWSCLNCYHVFHLRCVKRWARSPAAAVECGNGSSDGWRCPGCQHVNQRYPNTYRCFCGKAKDPIYNRHETPHSCGEVCGKTRSEDCPHPCNILCHPGPCPPCQATVNKRCDCSKTKQTLKCSQASKVKCTQTCEKTLNCSKHFCQQVCHPGSCQPCSEAIDQKCFCEKEGREVICGTAESFIQQYSCEKVCARKLECENHECQTICHPGVCHVCDLLPSTVTHCPCGRTLLADISDAVREACLDPVPTCETICDKLLSCGPPESPHKCQRKCHEGDCGLCEGTTAVDCRCGALSKNLSCQEAAQYSDNNPFTCDKRCNRKKNCKAHKCGKFCCVETEHWCDLVCGQWLSCGLHRCEELCHPGKCPACWQVSFEELHCRCGAEMIFPPIPCGTPPPECRQTCTRRHGCEHVVRHNCHNEENCPPCVELTEKWCMGKHERRRNIPCHLTDISCGMPCKKVLDCGGNHCCLQSCHKDACGACKQPCQQKRADCGHPCGSPCHGSDPCPKSVCQTEISIKCKCGNRSGKVVCMAGGDKDFNCMETVMLAMKMSDMQMGQSIDISSLTRSDGSKKRSRVLECTEQCGINERNKRLALALEIKNPDTSGKLGMPMYNEFLKESARKYPLYVAKVERALSELVKCTEESKQTKRSHAFAPGNLAQRKVIYELAEFYGCETHSYDQEPQKSVVAIAYRGKCWHPKASLTFATQREMPGRVLSAPIPLGKKEKDIRSSLQAQKQSTKVLGAWGKPPPSSNFDKSADAWGPPVGSTPAPWAKVASGTSSGATSEASKATPPVPTFDYFNNGS